MRGENQCQIAVNLGKYPVFFVIRGNTRFYAVGIVVIHYFLKITINSKLSFPFEWLLGRILAERKFSPIQNSPTSACLEKINRKKKISRALWTVC